MGGQSKHAGNVEFDVWEDEKQHTLFSVGREVRQEGQGDISPSGKNQSACWMMGSMMATTWTDVAAAISASVLDQTKHRQEDSSTRA